MGITLEELLIGRDQRRTKQQQLIEHYRLAVVCLTTVMPGNEKRNPTTLFVANEGEKAISETLGKTIVWSEFNDALTGPEHFYVTTLPPLEAKRLMVDVENTHLLGRLFDIDVLTDNLVPISREEVGETPRRCLLCGEKSVDCIRNHRHTIEEVKDKIQEIVERYKTQQGL